MKKFLTLLVLILILGGGGYVTIAYYSFIFAKDIQGEIIKVERVNQNETIITGNRPVNPVQMFSFAVAVRDEKGEIHTASSEDRQWAVAQAGQCVKAKFFPYPFWDFEKNRTFFGARLVQLYDCPKK
jgi:hypothetical protein